MASLLVDTSHTGNVAALSLYSLWNLSTEETAGNRSKTFLATRQQYVPHLHFKMASLLIDTSHTGNIAALSIYSSYKPVG